jgi:hypothetical protein
MARLDFAYKFILKFGTRVSVRKMPRRFDAYPP